jgi:hypothetical protein
MLRSRQIISYSEETLEITDEKTGPLRRPIHKEKDNIKIDIEVTGCDGADWILLSHGMGQHQAVVKTLTNLRFHKRRGFL